MKKALLTVAALALASGFSFGQARLALYEEFTGENCGPCAATNPHLDSLIAGQLTGGGANASKILMIKYMSPIPSAGQFYYQDQANTDTRISYYSVPFAPYARHDGAVPDPAAQDPGHPYYFTQTDIDNEAAVPSAFTITFSNPQWTPDYDSASVNVTITCVSAFTGTTMKLRTALVETTIWDTPPGSNGETDFPNVVRTMYPNAGGQTIANTWTVGQTQTITIAGPVPAYVDRQGAPFFAAWLQDDGSKAIAQAGKSNPLAPAAVDVASTGVSLSGSLFCTATTANVTPSVTIKNTGTSALTAATVYYKIDNGSWQTQAWTGNLAANATANVALPQQSLAPGSHMIYDSVGMPNAMMDVNLINNNSQKGLSVVGTAGNALANVGTGFENGGNLPANWVLYDANGNGANWLLVHSTQSNIGHGNSEWTIYHDNFDYPNGEANYAIIPTPTIAGPVSLDFWTAHKNYPGYNDRLDVVYSTDCGQNWTSVWNVQDPQLASDTSTAFYIPAGDAEWTQRSAYIGNVPAGAIIAFKATSGFSNSLFIDDVVARAGWPLNVNTAKAATTDEISVFPNPAKESATLQFSLSNRSNVQISVSDITGRVVGNVINTQLNFGQQQVQIPTANLPEGVYNITIQTEGGVSTHRLTVVK